MRTQGGGIQLGYHKGKLAKPTAAWKGQQHTGQRKLLYYLRWKNMWVCYTLIQLNKCLGVRGGVVTSTPRMGP